MSPAALANSLRSLIATLETVDADERQRADEECRSAHVHTSALNEASRVLADYEDAVAVVKTNADTERIDWLEAETTRRGNGPPVVALVVKRDYIRNSGDWVNIVPPVRAAIDRARKEAR